MKKSTLLEIILGTIGGLIFAIGMCMFLIPTWNLVVPGIVVFAVGFIILLTIIPIHRSHNPKKEHEPIDKGLLLTWIIGIVGALVLGYGMSSIMTGNSTSSNMLVGLVIGVVGLIICILNYPIYSYLKSR